MGCGVILTVSDTREQIKAETPKPTRKVRPLPPLSSTQPSNSHKLADKKVEPKIEKEISNQKMIEKQEISLKQQSSPKKKIKGQVLTKEQNPPTKITKGQYKVNEKEKLKKTQLKMTPPSDSSRKKKQPQPSFQQKKELIIPKQEIKIKEKNEQKDKIVQEKEQVPKEQVNKQDNKVIVQGEVSVKAIATLQSKVSIKQPLEEIKQSHKVIAPVKSQRSTKPNQPKNDKKQNKKFVPVDSVFLNSDLIKGNPQKKLIIDSSMDKRKDQIQNKLVQKPSSRLIKKRGQLVSREYLNVTQASPQPKHEQLDISNLPSKSSEKPRTNEGTTEHLSRKAIKRKSQKEREKEAKHLQQLNKRRAQEDKKKRNIESNHLKKIYL